MLKKIDIYIIKKFLGTYFFAIALILAIAVVFDFNEKLDSFIKNEAPWGKIVFEYYKQALMIIIIKTTLVL